MLSMYISKNASLSASIYHHFILQYDWTTQIGCIIFIENVTIRIFVNFFTFFYKEGQIFRYRNIRDFTREISALWERRLYIPEGPERNLAIEISWPEVTLYCMDFPLVRDFQGNCPADFYIHLTHVGVKVLFAKENSKTSTFKRGRWLGDLEDIQPLDRQGIICLKVL